MLYGGSWVGKTTGCKAGQDFGLWAWEHTTWNVDK